ncbi:hypothetical protein BDV95DRAFT_450122, partial [Massariosphaeria phaeospora]
ILITGASSGLGLAFLQHYTTLTPAPSIVALDISPLPPSIAPLPNVSFHALDITCTASLTRLCSSPALNNTPITLLIHAAGIRGLVPSVVQKEKGDVAAAETWRATDHPIMMRTLETNTWGTFNVVKTFLPQLQKAATLAAPDAAPKVVVLSSRMGSLSSNTAGGGYAYRASKAALNAVVKSFAVDVPEVRFLLLHPGRVETGLVGWKEEGAIGVEESVRDCVKVVERLGVEMSGTLVDRWGVQIGW